MGPPAPIEGIRIELVEDGVALLLLNRPERLNALTFEMFDELVERRIELAANPAVRVLVITGAGSGFCSGMDLDCAATLPAMSTDEMLARQVGWADAISGFRTFAKPVIAAVNGAAAGAGFGLALAADIRIASSAARFVPAFTQIGLTGGDVGVSWLLPRIVGLGHASDILLTGAPVTAQRAAAIGLVSDVVEPHELLEVAVRRAVAIARLSPRAVELTKDVLQRNVDAASLDDALALENRNQVLVAHGAEMTEALTAFCEKRPPSFGQQ